MMEQKLHSWCTF